MALVFGLLTALGYGVGDFLAGHAARRVPAIAVVLVAQAVGGLVMLSAALLLGGRAAPSALLWGAAAGVAIGLANVTYFRALAVGRMGVVAAVAGVWSAMVPFAVGLGLGERPAALAIVGVALVAVAIALVSGGDPAEPGAVAEARPAARRGARVAMPRGLAAATLAGCLFGVFFILLDNAQAGSPLWPAAAATLASVAAVALVVPLIGGIDMFRLVNSAIVPIVAVGVSQALATLAFIMAVREGLLSIVAVAGALSPVPTALCALLFLTERLTTRQLAGFVAALAGVALIAIA